MKKIAIASLLTLTACSSMGGGSGTVQSIGKDSYTVRILSPKSISDAKQKALSQSNDFCAKQAKKNIQMVQELSGTEDDGSKFYDLTFYCLTPGDKDFQRYRPAASTSESIK